MLATARTRSIIALILLGAVMSGIGLELALRMLPVTRGLYHSQDVGTFPLLRFDPHLSWTHSIGWDFRYPVHGTTYNFGQVSPFDYVQGERAVVVVGDSFVEGQLNYYQDSLQGRLQGELQGKPVYSFGMDGNSLSDYIATVQIISADFKFDALVFYIVDGDIRESFDEDPGHYLLAGRPDALYLQYQPKGPQSTLGRAVRDIGGSALVSYAFANLRFQMNDLLPSAAKSRRATTPASGADTRIDRDRRGVDFFLDSLEKAAVAPSHVVLALDSDRYRIYDPHLARRPKDDPINRQYLASEARRRGFQVLDMAPNFESDYREHRIHFDYFPLDRHLNGYGNGLVADLIAELLRQAANGMQNRTVNSSNPRR
jgi:hypothetical protein